MSDIPSHEIDPRVQGLRIQEARKARGLSQQEAAEALGISRPTYIAIEKGERPLRPEEMIRIADLYGRSVHDLLRQREPIRDFVRHFRTAATRVSLEDAGLDEATRLLQRLCDHYLELETICHAPLARNYPNLYNVQGRNLTDAAEEIADAERKRLGLGDGPVTNLRDLLETDVGLRIFYLSLPSRVAGLFVFTEPLGGCIAIQRLHPPGRRLWSLAHEYAHFLVDRYEPEVTVLRNAVRLPDKERFADSFAPAFLMPAMGLRRRFHDLKQSGSPITPATLLTLADLYGVSVQAMLLRLEDLRLIPVGTWDALEKRGFRVKEAQGLLGLGTATDEPWLPQRYMNLAAQAFEEELLTEGELMEILHTDRQDARRILQSLRQRPDVSNEGEAGELVLDFGEPLSR